MLYLPFILKNALRNPGRSALTAGSIAASFCMLGVLSALYHLFFFAPDTNESAQRLIVRNRISIANLLPLSYRNQIRNVPGVKEVIVFQWFGGVYKDSRDPANFFPRFAVDAARLFGMHPEYKVSDDQRAAFINERTACMVGRAIANRLNLKLGDRMPITGDAFPVNLNLTLRAIYDSEADDADLFFHYDYLDELLFRGYKSQVGMFEVMAERREDVPRLAHDIDALFRRSPFRTKTDSEKNFMLSFLSYLGNVKLFLIAVCGSLTITVVLVSANTIAMSVRERIREVGVLKTLGFTTMMVLRLVLGEAVLLAMLGGAIGLSIAYGIVYAIRNTPLPILIDLKGLELSPLLTLLGLLLAATVGLSSAFVPAWNTARRQILDALRVTD